MSHVLRAAHIIISLGLVLLIERFRLNPRLHYLLWALVAANELRGLGVVYEIGGPALRAMWAY